MRWRAHRCHWRQWDKGIKCRFPLPPQKKEPRASHVPWPVSEQSPCEGTGVCHDLQWETLIQPLCLQGRQSPASKTGELSLGTPVPGAVCDRWGSFSCDVHCEMVPLLLQALPGLPHGTLHHTDEETLLVFHSLLRVQQWGPFTALDDPIKHALWSVWGSQIRCKVSEKDRPSSCCSAAFCSQGCWLTRELWLGETSTPCSDPKDVPQKYWTYYSQCFPCMG